MSRCQARGALVTVSLLGLLLPAPVRGEEVIDIQEPADSEELDDPGLAPAPAAAAPAPRITAPPVSGIMVRRPPDAAFAPALDPARGRLSAMNTARLLRKGEVGFVTRGLLSADLAVGVTDWLELGFRSTPLLAAIPDIGFKGSVWMGSVRLRLVDTRLFGVTAETDGFSMLGWAGLRAGATLRLGTDRFAVHGGGHGIKLWDVDHSSRSMAAGLASGGFDLRLHRKVKLMGDVMYYRDSEMDLIVGTAAVRLHGRRFAADLGLMVFRAGPMPFPLGAPLVNLSVTF